MSTPTSPAAWRCGAPSPNAPTTFSTSACRSCAKQRKRRESHWDSGRATPSPRKPRKRGEGKKRSTHHEVIGRQRRVVGDGGELDGTAGGVAVEVVDQGAGRL